MTAVYQLIDGVKSHTTQVNFKHTATSAEATANTLSILTGIGAIKGVNLQIFRSDVEVTADADISWSGETITVADGASTYAITAGDVIVGSAFGGAE